MEDLIANTDILNAEQVAEDDVGQPQKSSVQTKWILIIDLIGV